MQAFKRLRRLPGVIAKDLPIFCRAFEHSGHGYRSDGNGWVRVCNRIEKTTPNPNGLGVGCDWPSGSELAACDVLPVLGQKLLRLALQEWPIRFRDCPSKSSSSPQVSFVFAHAGTSRLTQLRRTIRSVFAQIDCCAEVIVVDQSETPVFSQLPTGVIYRHLNKANVEAGWHKSWAYNVGARLASSEILVFQDGDICVPENYGSELISHLQNGRFDAASIQRFLFYLNAKSTVQIEASDSCGLAHRPLCVFQNWKGGTIAVRRDAFFKLGGFDEGFVDWGGEDDEFFNRCEAVSHCKYGYLPFIHLWHEAQTGSRQKTNLNISHVLPWRTQIPVAQRIEELCLRDFGNTSGPSPRNSYKSQLPFHERVQP